MRASIPTFLILFAGIFSAGGEDGAIRSIELPDLEPVRLEPIARIRHDDIDESSGIVRSRLHAGIYWTHNDSGDIARIFPLRLDGTSHDPSEPDRPIEGIAIPNAENIDWEDIAADDRGNLIIGAFGNNWNSRRDLAVYIVPEPAPYGNPTPPLNTRKIPFHYPDQDSFPPKDRNFDCEAVYFAGGKIYLLTKHRADTHTKLYRFDGTAADESNPVTLVDRFDIGCRVTGADASADGKRLAVVCNKGGSFFRETVSGIWVFHQQDQSARYFDGEIYWLPAWTEGAEAICWEGGESLILANEDRDIFRIHTSQLLRVR